MPELNDDDAREHISHDNLEYDGYCSNEQQQIERLSCEPRIYDKRSLHKSAPHCEDVNKNLSKNKHVEL